MSDPHLWKRGKIWQIRHGDAVQFSTGTANKELAKVRLKEYVNGLYAPTRPVKALTVQEYYNAWIETKTPPKVRPAQARDYRQHFTKYVLSQLSTETLPNVSLSCLENTRDTLLASGLSMGTVRNVLDGSLRAFIRDARKAGHISHDPFAGLEWPRVKREAPDPFTVQERDLILGWFATQEPYYLAYVRFQFETGCRPSEATALRQKHFMVGAGGKTGVLIESSRVLGYEGATKTNFSHRVVMLSQDLAAMIAETFLTQDREAYLFRNKFGGAMNPPDWTKLHWQKCLRGRYWTGAKKGWATYEPNLAEQVRYRSAYHMRHTAITEYLRRTGNAMAASQRFGTSLMMLQQNYCGILALSDQAEVA